MFALFMNLLSNQRGRNFNRVRGNCRPRFDRSSQRLDHYRDKPHWDVLDSEQKALIFSGDSEPLLLCPSAIRPHSSETHRSAV
jgi:hypothetical protein